MMKLDINMIKMQIQEEVDEMEFPTLMNKNE